MNPYISTSFHDTSYILVLPLVSTFLYFWRKISWSHSFYLRLHGQTVQSKQSVVLHNDFPSSYRHLNQPIGFFPEDC